MALTVGELVGYIDVKDAGVDKGLRKFDSDLVASGQKTKQRLDGMASDFSAAGKEAGQRLGVGFTSSADRELDQARAKLGDGGEKAGRAAGEGITDGVRKGTAKVDDEAAGAIQRATGKMKIAGAAAGLAAGAALVEGLTETVGRGKSKAKLTVGLLLTPAEAKAAGEAAAKVYADAWGDSFGDAADSVKAVVSSFSWLRTQSADVMARATEDALAFAEAMEIDVARGAQVAGQVVKSGLAEDVSGAFDLMLAAAARLPVDIREDLLDASEEYAQFFDALGINGTAAFGILVKGAEKGKYGLDKAGDAVKEFTIRSTDMSTASVAAYKAIGLDAKKMSDQILAGGDKAKKAFDKIVSGLLAIKDPTERANAAIGLFGTPLEDLSTRDIPLFLQSLIDGQNALGDFEGATKNANDELGNNFESKITSVKRTLENQFISFLEQRAAPAVNEFAKSLDLSKAEAEVRRVAGDLRGLWNDMVSDVREWADDHKKEIKDFTDAAEGYFREFMDFAKAAIDFIKAVWDAGGKDFVELVVSILTAVMTIIKGVLQIIKGIFEVFTGLLTGDWDKFWQGIRDIVHGQANIIQGVFLAFVAVVKGLFWLLRDAIMGVLGALTDRVLGFVGFMVSTMAKAFGWIPGIGPQLKQAVADFEVFRDRVNATLAGIKPVSIPMNFTGSAAGVAPRVVLGGLQHYARGGSIGAGEIGEVAEGGIPEILSSDGHHYLLMGNQSGQITPAGEVPSGSGNSASTPSTVTVVLDGRGWPDLIWKNVKDNVRVRGGGNVQVAVTR